MWEGAFRRHVNRVMKHGQPARAEVVSAEMVPMPGIRTGDVAFPWTVSLHVIPQDANAAPFDLEIKKMEVQVLVTPRPGMTLQVIYNPRKPEEMIVDPASVPKDQQEATAIDAANMRRAMELMADDAPKPAEPVADPIADARAKMEALTAYGSSYPEQVGEALAALREVAKDATATPPPAPAPGEVATAVQAQIAKLDALRAAGVLDEQTYNASKQRLLDSLSRAG